MSLYLQDGCSQLSFNEYAGTGWGQKLVTQKLLVGHKARCGVEEKGGGGGGGGRGERGAGEGEGGGVIWSWYFHIPQIGLCVPLPAAQCSAFRGIQG